MIDRNDKVTVRAFCGIWDDVCEMKFYLTPHGYNNEIWKYNIAV